MSKIKLSHCHPKIKCSDFEIGSVLKAKSTIYGSKKFPFDSNELMEDESDECIIESKCLTIVTDVEHYLNLSDSKVYYVLQLTFSNYVGWFVVCEWTKKVYDFETLMTRKRDISLNFNKMFEVIQK